TDESPGCHAPSAAIGCAPICLQASAHVMPLDGLSLTWMRPLVATRDAASTPSAGATFSLSASSALTVAIRIAGLMPAAVVLPPDPPLGGYMVSPISGLMLVVGMPNVSAATTATSVRVPVPRSC